MNAPKKEMHGSLKKLISEIQCLADHLSVEILIGVRLHSWESSTWLTNGTIYREKLMKDGLRFCEGDEFYEETSTKDRTIVAGDGKDNLYRQKELYGINLVQESEKELILFEEKVESIEIEIEDPTVSLGLAESLKDVVTTSKVSQSEMSSEPCHDCLCLCHNCIRFNEPLPSGLNFIEGEDLTGKAEMKECVGTEIDKEYREIDMLTEEVLNSEGFLEVDHMTLQSLVARDALSVSEIKLFEAVVRWAAAECLRRGLEPTPDQKRNMLGPVLHMIRIPTISLADFSNHVSKSGLLTPEECVKMFLYFTADDKPGNLDFNCEPRRKVGTERRCRRFPKFLHVSCSFYGLHYIAFKASRKVAIVGFGLYGWAQGCACHVVTAQLMYQGNVIAETHQRITAHCPEDEPTYRVKFDNPVEINADVLYSACVILNGAFSYYGMDGKERCETDGVTFTFLNSMDGSNEHRGTNVEHGQIPEIIFTEPH